VISENIRPGRFIHRHRDRGSRSTGRKTAVEWQCNRTSLLACSKGGLSSLLRYQSSLHYIHSPTPLSTLRFSRRSLSHHPTFTMPIRNPFAKRQDVQTNLQPHEEEHATRPRFEKVDTMGSKASSMSISSRMSQDQPPEYKMSGMPPFREEPDG